MGWMNVLDLGKKYYGEQDFIQRRIMEEAEWKILPEAVRLFCDGKIVVEENKVHIKE